VVTIVTDLSFSCGGSPSLGKRNGTTSANEDIRNIFVSTAGWFLCFMLRKAEVRYFSSSHNAEREKRDKADMRDGWRQMCTLLD